VAPRAGDAAALASTYRPKDHEDRIRRRWDEAAAFRADPAKVGEGRPPYSVLIPPPNVTGALHLGHALNNTLQDILVRAHRMMGFETLWMPGTDHAGIATQTVVEKRLLEEESKRRTDYQRDEFVEKVQVWKDEYEARITDQLKRMGCSCDWSRQRFTMDEICARAVREAFFQLFKAGLIYRGKRLVNWDPVTQTALADDEVENKEIEGRFYYMRYPLAHPTTDPGGHQPVTWSELDARGYPTEELADKPDEEQAWVTVATTRPETYLGDTAVAVNPHDPRAHALRGLRAELPLVGRRLPIIEDSYVVMPGAGDDPRAQFATGFLKVTPAHDPNDWELGQRHGLAAINVMAPDASISDQHGWTDTGDAHLFVGLSREEARKKVVQEFENRGLLEKQVPYTHSVGHSYRSHAPIEPYLSDQWYVEVKDERLAGAAQRALAKEQRTTDTWLPRAEPPVGRTSRPPSASSTPVGRASRPSSDSSDQPDHPVGRDLTIHKRNLPHWQLGGSAYFVTFRLREGQLSLRERELVAAACEHWHDDRAIVHVFTVMPDHVHILWTPLERAPGSWWSISELIQSVKSYTAHEINRIRGVEGSLWQTEYYDRIVRDEDEFLEKWKYIAENSTRAGIASRPEEYPFTQSPVRKRLVGSRRAVREHAMDGRDARPTGASHSPANGDGAMRFHPSRYAQMYESWHDGIRDWCISRQLWWGHRIPVWTVWFSSAHVADRNQKAQDSLNTADRQREDSLSTYLRHCGIADADFDIQLSKELIDGRRAHFLCSRNPAADRALSHLRRLVHQPTGRQTEELDVIRNNRDAIRQDFGDKALDAAGDLVNDLQDLNLDPDVLDTWFSSALWPLSTMGWPAPEDHEETRGVLDAFNPTSVLCTARDIVTLWVSRMVMFNRFFKDGDLPFRDVYIHPVIQDGEGKRMSKSAGNGVDPLDIIESHGADALRYTLCNMAAQTQDVRLPVETDPESGRNTSPKFDLGQRFCNKLWNASRFTMMMLAEAERAPDGDPFASDESLPLIDRWMLSRLEASAQSLRRSLEEYQFSQYAQTIYDLLWRDFCDWYLEGVKPTVKTDARQRAALRASLDSILRLLHPVCPFVTEAIHEALRQSPAEARPPGLDVADAELLCRAAWPDVSPDLRDEAAEAEFDRLRELVTTIRDVRAAQNVPPRKKITLHVDRTLAADIARGGGLVETLAGLERTTTDAPEGPATVFTFEATEHRLSGLVEAGAAAGAERERLEKQVAELNESIEVLQKRLSNPGYVEKAPAHLVQQTRDQLATLEREREAAQESLRSLS